MDFRIPSKSDKRHEAEFLTTLFEDALCVLMESNEALRKGSLHWPSPLGRVAAKNLKIPVGHAGQKATSQAKGALMAKEHF